MSQNIVAQDDESRNAPIRTGAISGRIINENGQPVSHAAIFLSSPTDPTQTRSSNTDDNGNFQVSGLDALIYTVSASAPTYVSAPRDPEALSSYYRIGDSVSISLIKGGVITGTVTSSAGEPVVQAGVRAILIRDANGKPPTFGRFVPEKTTDDRGLYRIYGLLPGTYIVAAGGRGTAYFSNNAYDTDAPTYAPSSARDVAMELTVRAGEETTADIRYRGERGHTVSGVVNGPIATNSSANLTLAQIVNGVPLASGFSVQAFNRKGFAFYGVTDGEYDLVAQSITGPREIIASESRHVTVKGADVSGIELVVRELASIRGRLVLETTTAADCKNKRQPLLSETVMVARRSEKNTPKDQLAFPNTFSQSVPDKSGDFALSNLAPGQFWLNTRFFAKYWYLRSMIRESPGAPVAKTGLVNPQADVARNGINLKFGERVNGVTITLAAGAASLRGVVKQPAGESLPLRLHLYLVPVEKENAEDVLRFFTTAVQVDGKFAFNNLPPGRYWAVARKAADTDPHADATLRALEEGDTRLKLRRAAEADKNEVEFKPCQNVVDYQLPFKLSSVKN
ncbi:MAG TPA: carboxypeptidase-like regulatory domain-containing protein [Pyrinomonadaceae bacterium]|nr:carboxypeptidase-like regulatory domain-containing protein [Pyrinomonadaceae bacterium]